jgi:hypothetical protein
VGGPVAPGEGTAVAPGPLLGDDYDVAKTGPVTALIVAALGLAACGGKSGDVRTVTATTTARSVGESSPSAPATGDAILIETRVTNAKRHTAAVLGGSVIGESAFCRGGTYSGGSNGPTITTRFRCPRGTLTVQYAPTQYSRVQGAVWKIVRGTGRFEGLRGGGSMVAKFEGDTGREIFTGTVRR